MILILILIAFALGCFAGWRAAVKFIDNKLVQDNLYLRNYNEQLKENSTYWKQQSDFNREIQNETINHHNNNLKNTLQNILFLLQTQPKENLKEEEKNQVEHIIKTIKTGISSSNVD